MSGDYAHARVCACGVWSHYISERACSRDGFLRERACCVLMRVRYVPQYCFFVLLSNQ